MYLCVCVCVSIAVCILRSCACQCTLLLVVCSISWIRLLATSSCSSIVSLSLVSSVLVSSVLFSSRLVSVSSRLVSSPHRCLSTPSAPGPCSWVGCRIRDRNAVRSETEAGFPKACGALLVGTRLTEGGRGRGCAELTPQVAPARRPQSHSGAPQHTPQAAIEGNSDRADNFYSKKADACAHDPSWDRTQATYTAGQLLTS